MYADTISTAGFSALPNHILLNPTISPDAKLAYALLRYFYRSDNGCYAKRETLSHYSNLSLFRLRNALNELRSMDLISIKSRGQGLPNLIHVLDTSTPDPPEPDLPSELMLKDEICCPDAPDVEEIAIPDVKNFDVSVEPLEENKLKNPSNILSTNPGNICESLSYERENEIINHFFQKKENRNGCKTELNHWRNTASMLLKDFSVDEIKDAITEFSEESRLFYWIGLKAPKFIYEQRHRKEQVVKLPVVASEPPEEPTPENQVHQTPPVARTAHDDTRYASETVRLLKAIRERVRPMSFSCWFKEAKILDIGDNSMILRVRTIENALRLEKEHFPLLQELTGKSDIEIVLST